MGCSNGVAVKKTNTLDTSFPLSKEELQQLRVFWENVKRRFEETAVENLIRLFRLNPTLQELFPTLKHLRDEQDMHNSMEFEHIATTILGTFDDVIDRVDTEWDDIVAKLENIAKLHSRVTGFNSQYYQCMEECLMGSLHEKHWEKFRGEEVELMRKMYKWVETSLIDETRAIEYQLIPGD